MRVKLVITVLKQVIHVRGRAKLNTNRGSQLPYHQVAQLCDANSIVDP